MFCETMLLLNGIGFCVFGMDLVVTVINHDDFSPVEKLCVSSSLSYVKTFRKPNSKWVAHIEVLFSHRFADWCLFKPYSPYHFISLWVISVLFISIKQPIHTTNKIVYHYFFMIVSINHREAIEVSFLNDKKVRQKLQANRKIVITAGKRGSFNCFLLPAP